MELWNKKLWSAAEDGNNTSVEECLANGVAVNCQDGWGQTALHFAAMNGHMETVDLLMSLGGDIESKDWEGQTPYDYTKNKGIKKLLKAARDKAILGLPVELYQLDKESANVFTDLLKEDSYELFELRSMLQGEQGTGKSTIARFLVGKGPTESRITTNGIDLFTGLSFFDDESEQWISGKQGYEMEDITVSRSIKSFKAEEPSPQKLTEETKTEMTEQIKSESMKPNEIPEGNCDNESFVKLKTTKTLECFERFKAFFHVKRKVQQINNSVKRTEFFKKSIEVAEKEFHKRKVVPVTIWDFGGQDVFYSTHQTFLTYRAVYMLVLDGSRTLNEPCKYKQFLTGTDRAKTQKDYVRFWINTIITYCKGEIPGFPKIMIILTHKDKVEVDIEKRRNEMFGEIEEMFNNSPIRNHLAIEDRIFVNAKNSNDSEMEKIKKSLINLTRIQPTWGQKLPKCFLTLELEILNLVKKGHTLISFEDIKKINIQQPIRPLTDSELKVFLKFQHSVGKIIYFDEPHLDQHIVISPTYLIDAFKSIITDEQFCEGDKKQTKVWQLMNNRGIILKQDIEAMWKQKKYAHFYKSSRYLLEVMSRLDILVEPRRYDSRRKRIPTEFYYVASMVHKQDTTGYLQSPTFSQRNIAISFDASNSIIPPALFFRFVSYCLSIWSVKIHGDNDDMLFHRSAVFAFNASLDIHVQCEDERIIVRLVHERSHFSIERHLASSIRECLLAALSRISQLYIKISSEGTANIRSFDVNVCCTSPTNPCTIAKNDIGDIWNCPRHQIEHTKGLVLLWFMEQETETCDSSCPVTDENFLQTRPTDRHLKRLVQQYDMNEVRELVIELGLLRTEFELCTSTLDEKFRALHKCYTKTCFKFHDLKNAAEKRQIQNVHTICKVARERHIDFDKEPEKWDLTLTDEDIDKLANVVGSYSLAFLVELDLTFHDWERIEHCQKQEPDLLKINRMIMEDWRNNCTKHKIKPSLRIVGRAFENSGINIKLMEDALF